MATNASSSSRMTSGHVAYPRTLHILMQGQGSGQMMSVGSLHISSPTDHNERSPQAMASLPARSYGRHM